MVLLLTSSFGSRQGGGGRDFASVGIHGCQRPPRPRLVLLRRRLRILHPHRAMGRTDPPPPRNRCSAAPRPTRSIVARPVSVGVTTRDAPRNGRRHPQRRSRRRRRSGPRNPLGPPSRLAVASSVCDACAETTLSMDRCTATLHRRALRTSPFLVAANCVQKRKLGRGGAGFG
jgi:hypothetical protein